VLRVMGFPASNGLVLYANSQAGLAIVDVSERDEPQVLRTSEFIGTPIGVFELTSGVAVVVFSPWDRGDHPETVVRAVDISRVGRESKKTLGRTLGEITLPGAPRDAVRIGEVLVVTRDAPKSEPVPSTAPALPMTAVTTFTFGGNEGGDDPRTGSGLVKRDELRIPGHGSVMGASPRGVAIARATPVELGLGAEKSSITWIGIAQTDFGTQRLAGMTTISGVVPHWRRAADHVVDVTEDSFVRIVACATAACPGSGKDAAAYAGIDFSDPNHPRVVSWHLLARAGDAAFNFDGDRLFVARPPNASSGGLYGEATTELAVFRTTPKELEPLGSVKLKGTVSSLAIRPYRVQDDVIALGWTGSASAGKRAIIHHIDTRKPAPRLIGSTSFGGDWTWSPAYDDERAMSFDPTSRLAALPMTTMRGKRGAFAAAQVFSLEPLGPPRLVLEREVAVADRLLFVDGRLLAFSSEGVVVVRDPNERELNRMKRFTAEDVRSLLR
jgi:hypothetical protein